MAAADDPPEEVWLDEDAGPVVRPYALTGGRTRSDVGEFDLIALVIATKPVSAVGLGMAPEHVAIVRMCQHPLSVAEVAAHLNLPVGIVRVLLGDLLDEELIRTHQPPPVSQAANQRVLNALIDGLRSL